MSRVVVCICTYNRPEGLANLLDQLTLLSPTKPDAVVVIDNHAGGEGAALCEKRRADYPIDLDYAVEPQAGISFARNAAVALALTKQADLIGFLDDDEWPEPQWLAELIRVSRENDADAVGGPTLSVFPADTPDAIKNNPYYGADMNIGDGEPCKLEAAGNFLIKASTISTMGPAYFRPEFAQSGGEDLAFFTELAQKDARMYWSTRAIVHESVPMNRLSADWLKERIINIANSRVRVMQILEPGPLPAMIRGLKTIALFCQASIMTLAGLVSPSIASKAAELRWKFWGKFTAHLNRKTIRGEGH